MSRRGRYEVVLAPAATRELGRLPPGDSARLRGPILALAVEPRPFGSRRVAGTDYWRVRVGSLRVTFAIDEGSRRVIVLRVARRSESTYRRKREP